MPLGAVVPPTTKQKQGAAGEQAVCQRVPCPSCGKARHLTRLPPNFQCADVICKFCGFLAQVKTAALGAGQTELPDKIPGAAWGPQQEQIVAGIYHGLFLVGLSPAGRLVLIDYVPPHILQGSPEVFEPRNPLRPTAKRHGWTGFVLNLKKLPKIGIKRVYP